MSAPEPKISQEMAARVMFAAEKWVAASFYRGLYQSKKRETDLDAAKQAFADLIASMTDSEGL